MTTGTGIIRSKKGRFVAGAGSPNPAGKPKGLKDKITKIKEAICNNFDQSKFKVWSERHESEFYELMIKVMPKEIDLSGELNFPVININMPGHNDDTKPKR